MLRIKTVLYNSGNIFKMNTFLTLSPRAVFRSQSKVYGGAFLQKQLATTYFYMILYDFLNCSAFVDINQALPENQQWTKRYLRDIYFYALFLNFFRIFSLVKVLQLFFQTSFFSFGYQKSGCWSRQIVTIEREFAWADSALVVLQRWSFEQVSL